MMHLLILAVHCPPVGHHRQTLRGGVRAVKLRPADAANYLGLATATLAKLRCVGGSPIFYRLGRKIVYGRADLDAWFASRRARSTLKKCFCVDGQLEENNGNPEPNRGILLYGVCHLLDFGNMMPTVIAGFRKYPANDPSPNALASMSASKNRVSVASNWFSYSRK